MPLLGKAAVAMWWDMDPAMRSEFQDWHSHEHFPERMAIPGFRRGSRWASSTNPEGFFVMYELDAYETLTSQPYLDRLNNPTPWSVKMMPHHRNMVRSQCRIVESRGGGIPRLIKTIRLSPRPGKEQALHLRLAALITVLPLQPGLTAAHLLQTQTPDAPATEEQKIRGGDAVADWIFLVSGYDADALAKLDSTDLQPGRLIGGGVGQIQAAETFNLMYSLAAGEG
jgi:hypothetical protein